MRLNLLSAVRAILSLSASGVFAGVTCDPKHDLAHDSTVLSRRFRIELAESCIEEACTTVERAGPVTKKCEAVLLTITHLNAASHDDFRGCVKGFRSILDQCIEAGDFHGGVLQTHDALYDIANVDQHERRGSTKQSSNRYEENELKVEREKDEDRSSSLLQDRQSTPRWRGLRSRTRLSAQRKSDPPKKQQDLARPRVPPPKELTQNKPTAKDATTPKTPPPKGSTAKTTPKDPKSKAPVTSKNPNKSCTSSSKGKSKVTGKGKGKGKGKGEGGKRTTRDIIESFLPRAQTDGIFPRTTGQSSSSECENTQWYTYTQLDKVAGVDWWSFNRLSDGWETAHPATENAGKILREMTLGAKLDVIKMPKAKLEVVGDPTRALKPDVVAKTKDTHLLTNGGFFEVRTDPTKRRSVGKTSLSDAFHPISRRYQQYYGELRENSQFLSAGPTLQQRTNFDRDEFVWREDNALIPGSLAHASQPNERLAIAIIGSEKYIFAYTALKRANGVNTNKLRTIMDTFLQEFAGTTITKASIALNLDGGGSIHMAWRDKGEETIIARGDVKDDGPPLEEGWKGSDPREVANYLKFTI